MLDRLKNLINAVSNNVMNKMETPEVLAEQAEAEIQSNLKKVKEALTASMTNEKMLEQQIKKAAEEAATAAKRATVAVQQGSDDVAKQYLAKRQEHEANHVSLQAQLTEQTKATATLKERYADLQVKAREFRQKKNDMITRSKASDALSKAHEITSNTSGSGMDKWEQKIVEKEIKGQAMREMSDAPLEDKFKAIAQNSELDDELAALKAQMAQAAPKLIVDKTESKDEPVPEKTIEDDNVPMVVEEIKDDDGKSS
ncbi:MAG TPA: PspA/IM30 family protein [Chroococcales cyanobacterium]